MSHNVRMTNVRFTDIAMLASVVEDISKGRAKLDTEMKRFRTYRGQPDRCDMGIRMPGQHDIGLMRQPDGSYLPVFDPYAMDTCLKLPQGTNYMGAVSQEYAIRTAEYEAAQNSMETNRIIDQKTGTVTLEILAS